MNTSPCRLGLADGGGGGCAAGVGRRCWMCSGGGVVQQGWRCSGGGMVGWVRERVKDERDMREREKVISTYSFIYSECFNFLCFIY
ncbi:hypothetical protein HanIR_Chr12g0588751 [Helianthus annuus]|nr:hypothetical protein HanIR_Chr12g0588751 [Helianthus annuus]